MNTLAGKPFLTAAIACLFVWGCAAGPDFRRPDAPGATGYTSIPPPEQTAAAPEAGGEAQRFISGMDIPGAWWTLFHFDPLDRLIRDAFSQSPTLALARARVREAQENRRAAAGGLYPEVTADASASRQRASGAAFGQPEAGSATFNLLNASLEASYSPDLFGSLKRQLESLDAQVEVQQFQYTAAYLSLSTQLVVTAIREASLAAQLQAAQEVVTLAARSLTIAEKRLDIGGIALADVLAQRTLLAQARAVVPPLEGSLAQARHQLAVLTGRPPAEAKLPEIDFSQWSLPTEIPVSLPSALVRQRPDILTAEALLHGACALVGVATANLYPQLTLSASLGQTAATGGALFDSASTIWSVGAGLLQPVFRGGTLTARKRAAIAVYDQAWAQYQETVLQAFREVADLLRALEADARTLQAAAEAEAAAQAALALADQQFAVGAISELLLLDAQRRQWETRLATIQARAARFTDTAALFQAMGGGWWNRDLPMGPTYRETEG